MNTTKTASPSWKPHLRLHATQIGTVIRWHIEIHGYHTCASRDCGETINAFSDVWNKLEGIP